MKQHRISRQESVPDGSEKYVVNNPSGKPPKEIIQPENCGLENTVGLIC